MHLLYKNGDLRIPFLILFASLLYQWAWHGVTHCPANSNIGDGGDCTAESLAITVVFFLFWLTWSY